MSVHGVAPPTTPMRAAVVMYVPISIPVSMSIQRSSYPYFAPTFELIRRLPGPNTTHAVIRAGPIATALIQTDVRRNLAPRKTVQPVTTPVEISPMHTAPV